MTVVEMVHTGDTSDIIRIKYSGRGPVKVYAVTEDGETEVGEYVAIGKAMHALRDVGYRSVRKYDE